MTPALALAATDQVTVRSAPAWAERVTVAPDAAVPRNELRWGTYGLLDDHQVHVTDGGVVEYFRRVRKVLSPTAVQNASEVSIDFDPSFQRLVLHDVVLLRDGKRINELNLADVRVIEKESDADEDIYDGSLTALLFLKDVRPGDVIDYSYTLDGVNPLLGAKYADEFDFGTQVPLKTARHRVIYPAGRTLRWRATFGTTPSAETRGGEKVLTWTRHDLVAQDVEDKTPEWYDPWETVQVTEYASWHDVAQWADDLFQPDDASRAAVHALAAKIRAEHPSRDAQLAAAIRFVQDDIRYLGIEMGRNSHEPHQPADTLAQRYGDCKDKSFLLALLLRDLGVEADPALVNTKLRQHLDAFLPSPFLFDHVITQVRDGGRVYWIDGTIADQGGTLASIDTPNDERALVVRPDTSALAVISTRERGTVHVERTYTVHDVDTPADLDVVTTYSGEKADGMRADLATMSLSELARQEINRIAADTPRITPSGPPRVSDDRLHNVVTVRERYSVTDLWRDGVWSYRPRSIERHLALPETIVRTMPLAVEAPLDLVETVTVHLPFRVSLEARDGSIVTPALRYERQVERSGRTVIVRDSLRSLADSVPVARVAEHIALLDDAARLLPVTIPSRRPTGTGWEWGTAGLVAFVGACTSLAVRRRNRLRQDAGDVEEPPFAPVVEPHQARHVES